MATVSRHQRPVRKAAEFVRYLILSAHYDRTRMVYMIEGVLGSATFHSNTF